MKQSLYKLTAFSVNPEGGNPAGVWLGDQLPNEQTMQEIAADVGFSETAFIAPLTGKQRKIRYFSPEAEVPFCGHATIASGVVLGQTAGDGLFQLNTAVGEVPVDVRTKDGIKQASLTSITPKHRLASRALVKKVLAALRWEGDDLDQSIVPAMAFAGAWHLVLAVESKNRLDNLDYDFEQLKAIMLEQELTTIQLIWRESDAVFHSRNPFPVGGVVEDPATGAAAAALGGYLRDAGYIKAPQDLLIRQGEVMGRPSKISVQIPEQGGITVTGTAVNL